MATTVYHGINMQWGCLPSSSAAAFGDCTIQTHNMTRTGDELEIRNEVGDQVAWVGYGVKRTATFTYYVTKVESADGTLSTMTAPTYGQLVTLTNGGSTSWDFLSGSYIAKDITFNASNTDAVKVDVALVAYPNITS